MNNRLKKLMTNKNNRYIVIAALVIVVALLVTLLLTHTIKKGSAEPPSELETIVPSPSSSPTPSPSPTPVITPPAQGGDPASGSDIILDPDGKPATESDLKSIDKGQAIRPQTIPYN